MELKTKGGILRRPVQHLIPLEIQKHELDTRRSTESQPNATGGEYVATPSSASKNLPESKSKTESKSETFLNKKDSNKRVIKKPSYLKDYIV